MQCRAIVLSLVSFCLLYSTGYAQHESTGYSTIPLNGLGAFRQTGKNWVIGSGAKAEFSKTTPLQAAKGSGVLINLPDARNNSSLITVLEFADVEIEMDFMLAKNSSPGILFLEQYEVHLADSWAKPGARMDDCGAISISANPKSAGVTNNNESGYAPLMNVCRAPGLWQHIKIKFRAPGFDLRGNKTTNAKFEEVYLNGTLIQQELHLNGPLGLKEKTRGPIVFLGNGGGVAFRNIRYNIINPLLASLDHLNFRYYQSDFKDGFPDLKSLKPVAQDSMPLLTWDVGKGTETFALDIAGNLQLPADDLYTVSFLSQGPGRVYIDDQLVIERNTNRWNRSYFSKQVKLSAGAHPVRIVYVKNVSGVKPALALALQGVSTDRVNLQDKASVPSQEATDPVIIEPKGKPYLLRSFINFERKKLTHVISVGDHREVNYTYDLKQGALIQVWRGKFLDVTNMWVDRGEPQLATPIGSLVTLSDAPTLAVLSNANAAWPDSVAFDNLENKGYSLDRDRSPTFKYILDGTAVVDKISLGAEGQSLLRELTVSDAPANMYCRLATGSSIEQVSEGLFAVNDKSYYIRVDKRFKPAIRQAGSSSELIVPLQNNPGPLSYSITW